MEIMTVGVNGETENWGGFLLLRQLLQLLQCIRGAVKVFPEQLQCCT